MVRHTQTGRWDKPCLPAMARSVSPASYCATMATSLSDGGLSGAFGCLRGQPQGRCPVNVEVISRAPRAVGATFPTYVGVSGKTVEKGKGAANYRTIPKAIDARIANAKRKIAACTVAVDGVKGSLIECFMSLWG